MLRDEQIGGGFVRLGFNIGDRRTKAGERLSREAIMKMPISNRRTLISSGKIEVFPIDTGAPIAAPTEPADRHLIHLGRGYYDVIEGRKLNAEPLTREDAVALAAR